MNAETSLLMERARVHAALGEPARVDTDEAFEAAYTDLADRIAPTLNPGADHG